MLSDAIPMLSYEGAESPAAGVDARVKVVAGLVGGIGVLIAHDPAQFAAIALLVLAAAVVARIRPEAVWSSVKPVFTFLVVGGLLIVLTTPGRGWSVGPAHVSRTGLALAGRLSIQLVLLLAITTLVTYTTAPLSIANALRRMFGFLRFVKVPVEDMTTMLTIAITFVPIMSREVDRYLTARVARGASPKKFGMWSMLGDMLAPLIQANLQRGEELALALDTRLYGYGPRTHRLDAEGMDRVSVLVGAVAVLWVGAGLVMFW